MKITDAIKVLRFPLAVLVVYIHYAPFQRVDLWALTAVDRPITTTLYTLFSFLVGSVAVPIFVAISGYLYFIKIGNNFSRAQYIKQSRKRVYTLAIPYLGWIAITWIAGIIYNLIKYDTTFTQLLSETWQNLYYILWAGPLYFPFYFIRDLIVLSLLAPLWHWLIKHTSWVWLVASLLLYFSPIELFTGLSTRLLFYYSLGAFFGIKGYKELTISRPLGFISILVTMVAASVYIIKPVASAWHTPSLKLFEIALIVVLLFGLQGTDTTKPPFAWCKKMGIYSFFIYSTHQIYIINFARGFQERILTHFPAPLDDLLNVVTYITFPQATVAILVVAYKIWAKVAPRSLSLLLGGRI
ncbi:acyltransferase family protein [Porphyromonas somerae]|uniref:acyltransferase family protein n=1 Tax=Porphyromonas somerae TaxID=322095 RepID=UPI001FCC97F6|nr:acyltransferase [Porphyromonas somerae]